MTTMLACLAVLASLALGTDTTVLIGEARRDLTGDGRPETIRIVGVGQSIDSLEVTLTITADADTLYRQRMVPLTLTVGYDAGRRRITRVEHRVRIRELGSFYFDDRKFMAPAQFVERLRDSAPGRVREIPETIARDGRFPTDTARAAAIWGEMQRTTITVFEFSPGGDGILAIAWSPRDKRFYRLMECC